MPKYYFQTGYFESVVASINLGGPQSSHQVPERIKAVFGGSKMKVKSVYVVYEGVTGADKIDSWSIVEESNGKPTSKELIDRNQSGLVNPDSLD